MNELHASWAEHVMRGQYEVSLQWAGYVFEDEDERWACAIEDAERWEELESSADEGDEEDQLRWELNNDAAREWEGAGSRSRGVGALGELFVGEDAVLSSQHCNPNNAFIEKPRHGVVERTPAIV